MTALPKFLKAFSDVTPIERALAEARERYAANIDMARRGHETPFSVLNSVQRAVTGALLIGDIDTRKRILDTEVRKLLKDMAEKMARESLHPSHGELTIGADEQYLNKSSELVLQRFDTLLAMAKELEKPGTVVSGERTEVLGHNPQIASNVL